MQKQIKNIETFLSKEVKKRGFDSVVVGLSGGIDSAVVSFFCNKIFGAKAKAFILPSSYSNPKNTQDAIKFAQSINLSYEVISIAEFQNSFTTMIEITNTHDDMLRLGNFCARIRMAILYDKSSLYRSLVIGTSNKSELMLGYGTIYGDLACAINPIGNIFKSDIFEIAKAINIPNYIIDKKPSADLYAGQSDEGELGYSYSQIDQLLRQIDKGKKEKDLIDSGFEAVFVKSILKRIHQNKFKRKLPKIAKL